MNRELILVAEDDLDATELLRTAFEFEAPDIQVAYTANGEEAISYLQAKPPHMHGAGWVPILLLLDLKMPRVDGLDVLKWLQLNPLKRPKCIAVLSSSDEEADRQRAAQLGADYYFPKPLTYAELCDLVAGFGFFCRQANGQLKLQARVEGDAGIPSVEPVGGLPPA